MKHAKFAFTILVCTLILLLTGCNREGASYHLKADTLEEYKAEVESLRREEEEVAAEILARGELTSSDIARMKKISDKQEALYRLVAKHDFYGEWLELRFETEEDPHFAYMELCRNRDYGRKGPVSRFDFRTQILKTRSDCWAVLLRNAQGETFPAEEPELWGRVEEYECSRDTVESFLLIYRADEEDYTLVHVAPDIKGCKRDILLYALSLAMTAVFLLFSWMTARHSRLRKGEKCFLAVVTVLIIAWGIFSCYLLVTSCKWLLEVTSQML